MTIEAKVKEFGGGCPKCAAPTGIRSHCPGCNERRGREHLHAACTSCGYSWIEKTADAKAEKPKKGARK